MGFKSKTELIDEDAFNVIVHRKEVDSVIHRADKLQVTYSDIISPAVSEELGVDYKETKRESLSQDNEREKHSAMSP